jgi:hypothetical protein
MATRPWEELLKRRWSNRSRTQVNRKQAWLIAGNDLRCHERGRKLSLVTVDTLLTAGAIALNRQKTRSQESLANPVTPDPIHLLACQCYGGHDRQGLVMKRLRLGQRQLRTRRPFAARRLTVSL